MEDNNTQEPSNGKLDFAKAEIAVENGSSGSILARRPNAGVGIEPLRQALDLSPTPVCFLSLETLEILHLNPAAQRFLSIENGKPFGNTLFDFVPEKACHSLHQSHQLLLNDAPEPSLVYVSSADGAGVARLLLRRVGNTIISEDQTTTAYAASGGVETDPLTGLSNRRFFTASVRAAFERENQNWGVLFIDLNNYKDVNDQCGHVTGDRVLASFAAKLIASARPIDVTARFGGDEFVMLGDQISNEDELRAIADRIAAEVTVELTCQQSPILVSASVGCAMASAEFETVDQLIDAADRDMYRAKRRRPK